MRNILLIVLLFSLSACATKFTPITSNESQIFGKLDKEISQQIAIDIADYVSKGIIPKDTSIALHSPIDENFSFSQILDDEFRSRSYLITDSESADISLFYTLKIINEIHYVQFRYNSVNISRAYNEHGSISNWTAKE